MRYLTLAEGVRIAEAVTGVPAETLVPASRIELLDSALHAPAAGFGDVDLYPTFAQKAGVLVVRIARNHPLPDGNKRLAWMCLRMSCALNGRTLVADDDEVVAQMLAVASGEVDEAAMAAWVSARLASDG